MRNIVLLPKCVFLHMKLYLINIKNFFIYINLVEKYDLNILALYIHSSFS